jgi:phage regulator Rha-like protein
MQHGVKSKVAKPLHSLRAFFLDKRKMKDLKLNTMTSREMAIALEQPHKDLLKSIKRYVESGDLAEGICSLSSYIGKDGAKAKQYILDVNSLMVICGIGSFRTRGIPLVLLFK